MTVEQFAAAQAALGTRVEKVGQVYWTRVRRFFGRPLLPYEAHAPAETEAPQAAWGGFQHVVTDERDANSTMNFLMLDDLGGYARGQLSHNRRRLINAAAKHLEIRPVRELGELQEQGFAVYSSFYQRTSYRYLSSRRHKENYCRWAATLFREAKTMILGAYGSGSLMAISVSYWVKGTLLYATYFSNTAALRQGASELMFHALREGVAQIPGIRQVFVRRYQGGNGMDQYYLMRGAKLVIKPARLRLQPAVAWVLKRWVPQQYALLRGAAGAGE